MNKTTLSKCLSKIIDYRGKTPAKLGLSWSQSGYKALSANNVKCNGLQNLDSIYYGDDELYSKWMKEEIKIGDILLTSEAPAGQVLIWNTDEKIILSQRLFALRTNENFDSTYLKYFLQSDIGQNEINRNSSGSTVFGISAKMFEQIHVLYPEKNDQQKIASVLSSLDAKIELNNRINTELEAMAKTLYDYWFVQFDFPDENGKPYKSSGGEMEYNAKLKREIPKGWEVKELSDIANITMGQSPLGESYNEEGNGIVFYQGCTDFGIRFPTVRKFTTQPTRYAKMGDILLSVRAPVGTMNIANEKCCIGRGLAALNSKHGANAFLYEVMANLKQVFDRRNTDGTTFGSITKDDLFSLSVVIPSNEKLINQYHEKINPAFEKQNMIGLENQQLAELRDWLLPMLMNGQVKVA